LNSRAFSWDRYVTFGADEVVILGVQTVIASTIGDSELENLDFITNRALTRWGDQFFARSSIGCHTINFDLKIEAGG
jgi:hypothetical protein